MRNPIPDPLDATRGAFNGLIISAAFLLLLAIVVAPLVQAGMHRVAVATAKDFRAAPCTAVMAQREVAR